MQYSDVVSVGRIAIVVIVGLLSFAVFFCRRSVSWVAHARKKTILDLPPRPKHQVHARSSLVREIRSLFTRLQQDSPCSVAVVYVEGPPGFGKTQLARQYAEDFSIRHVSNRPSSKIIIHLVALTYQVEYVTKMCS